MILSLSIAESALLGGNYLGCCCSHLIYRVEVSLPQGVLNITLVEARALINKDSALLGQGVSDPYAVLEVTVDSILHRFR